MRPLVPELLDSYNWPPKMFAWRMFRSVELLTNVDVIAPRVAYRTPPAPPVAHRSVPLVLTALRTLAPVDKSVNAVLVSMFPLESTRPMTRGNVLDELVVRLVAPPVAES